MNAIKTAASSSPKTEQTITSLEIAKISRISHRDLLRSIRSQEVAWQKVCKRNFALSSIKVKMPNGGTRKQPIYKLTQKESLYISSKFNDEARAKLIMRWYELEVASAQPINGILPITSGNNVGYPRKEFLISIGRSGTSGSVSALKKQFPEQCLIIGRCACITAALCQWLIGQQVQKQRALSLKSNQLSIGYYGNQN